MSVSAIIDAYLETTFTGTSTAVQRDLSLNFKKIMEESPLEETDRWMNLLATGVALHNKAMMGLARTELQKMGLSEEHIQEAAESAGIMGMLNTYYKFKGFLSPEVAESYNRAGLRMNSLGKPVNGKEKFEMMAFTVSVVNGCPTCVSSHEKALKDLGLSADKIHDLARLAAVCKGLDSLQTARS